MMEWVVLSAGQCGSECVEYSGADALNSKLIPLNLKLMYPVFEDPISSFTSIATREGSSVTFLYLLYSL